MTKLQRGAVLRTANAWDSLRSGTLTATTTAAPLSATRVPIMEVIVQNDPDSQGTIFVGDARSQYYQLAAGANVTVKVNDLSTVYVRALAGTVAVNYLAGE